MPIVAQGESAKLLFGQQQARAQIADVRDQDFYWITDFGHVIGAAVPRRPPPSTAKVDFLMTSQGQVSDCLKRSLRNRADEGLAAANEFVVVLRGHETV